MASQPKRNYRFGHFTLDLGERTLLRDDRPVPLTPKVFDTLALLVENHGHLVQKEELMRRLWPDAFVEEGNLTFNVSVLRRALGERIDGSRFIETVARQGYRFVAAVEEVEEAVPASQPAVRAPASEPARAAVGAIPRRGIALRKPWPLVLGGVLALLALILVLNVGGLRDRLHGRSGATLPAIRSIAVLPLANLSGDPAQDYFADGMTDALITDLAKIRSLKVISRTSAMQYKGTKKSLPQIGQELKVDAVVEGSVERAGDRVRISAELIYAATDAHIWAENYERDLKDVLALQYEVAQAIAREIKIQLTPHEQAHLTTPRTVSPEAYEAYLKGVYFLNEYATDKAVQYFQQAIDKDPNYAQAYAGLAYAYRNLALGRSRTSLPERFLKAKEAAMKALDIDDTLAEPHYSLGMVRLEYDWDWPGAEREFKRAIDLNPSYPRAHLGYATYLTVMARCDEAVAEAKRVQQLDPVAFAINFNAASVWALCGKPDQAEAEVKKVVEMYPYAAEAHWVLGQVYVWKKMYGAALAELQQAVKLSGGLSPTIEAWLGYTYAVSGRKREAIAVVNHLAEESKRVDVWPESMAVVYIGLGDKDKAFAWLEKGFRERSRPLILIKADPTLAPLRDDPRYKDLVRRMGLPP